MTRLKYLLVCLVFLMYFVHPSVTVIRPSSRIYVKERFYAYLDKPGEVKTCWFQIQYSRKQQIYLNSTTPITLVNGFTILPFSNTTCGMRGNVTENYYSTTIELEAEFVNGDRDAGSIYISEASPTQSIKTTVTTDIGKTKVKCKLSNGYRSRCQIVADTGERWEQCEVETIIRSNRTFDCYVYNWGDTAASREQIIIRLKQQPLVTTSSMEETANSIILRCQFHTGPLQACVAELPYRASELYIKNGLMNGQYSSYDTDVGSSKCAIEIPKPLKANEVGLWRIVNYESDFPAGCLFYVGEDEQSIIQKELELVENKEINIYENNYTLPEIVFNLPFELNECFLNVGFEVIFPTNRFIKESTFGRCTFTGGNVNKDSIVQFGGTGKNYDEVVLRDVKVNFEPKYGKVITPKVEAKVGEAAELKCRSSFDDPISYCTFSNPEGQVYLLDATNNTQKFGDVQYLGRGLEYGDCGIRINQVQKHDFGDWFCQYSVLGEISIRQYIIVY